MSTFKTNRRLWNEVSKKWPKIQETSQGTKQRKDNKL